MLGLPTSENKTSALTNIYRVVADSLVEARDDRHLYRDLKVDCLAGMAFEDLLNELAVQAIKVRIHIIDCGGFGGVIILKCIHCRDVQLLSLLAHLAD